jgi:hypothetical protein
MADVEPERRLTGRMPDWAHAQPVTSWWGGVYPRREKPWVLAVVDPAVPLAEAGEQSVAAASWVDRAARRRIAVVAAVATGASGIGALAWADGSSAPLLVRVLLALVGGLLCAAACAAARSWWRLGHGTPPAEICWR